MEFKDYYEILGVKPDADAAAIKSAYRKLARKYHPDVSKEAGAEDRFKAVGEAYEALKDPERRRSYDELRAGGYRGGDQFRPPPDWAQHFGQDARTGDDEGYSDFFDILFGRGGHPHAHPHARPHARPRSRRGQDVRAAITIDPAQAYAGSATRLNMRDAEGNDRVLEVKIPPGIESGKVIRLAGQGQSGLHGGPAGDLLLEVSIRDTPEFRIDGRNVRHDLALAPWEAALGASLPVPTLGGTVELNVPAGSQSGRSLRLKGRGLPGKPPGDQLVTLVVRVPAAETDDQKAAYKSYQDAFPDFDPRSSES